MGGQQSIKQPNRQPTNQDEACALAIPIADEMLRLIRQRYPSFPKFTAKDVKYGLDVRRTMLNNPKFRAGNEEIFALLLDTNRMLDFLGIKRTDIGLESHMTALTNQKPDDDDWDINLKIINYNQRNGNLVTLMQDIHVPIWFILARVPTKQSWLTLFSEAGRREMENVAV